MTRRIFIPCLNSEPKLYNFSYGTIVGAVSCTLFLGIAKGLLWGLGGGAVGAIVGGWISREWFRGEFQRKLYWNLPYFNFLIDKNLPKSSNSHEL